MTELSFIVVGEPIGKERARVVRKPGQRTRAITPGGTRAYEDRVRWCGRSAAAKQKWSFSDDDRFEVTVHVLRRYRDKGPDADNVLKAVLDALNGVAYRDDAHVRTIHVDVKQRTARESSVHVRVRKIEVDE